ncbi:MAG: V-type ATPase subunit [Deltaproteobacteria bacterium]|nr:V-type ATPase subunit [Deltaproteobacteria bacterium]
MVDLSYLNARIRAWKGELLTKEAYDGLIAADGIKSLISRLKETVYVRDIEIASAMYKNERELVVAGLNRNLAKTFKELWSYSSEQTRVLLRAIFSIWEVYNLKTLLRARANGISPDESASILIPAGEMNESALKELNQQKDVFEVVKLLSTWGSQYARPMQRVMKQYMRERHIAVFEFALDRFAASHAFYDTAENDINKKIIEQFIKQRIDCINISTLLKLGDEGVAITDVGDYFLAGGDMIHKGGFLRLSESRNKSELLKGLADLLKDSRWKKLIGSAEPESAFFLEERFEELLRHKVCRLTVVEPLSIALAICFIYKKIREIKNLRVIVRAKIFDVPAIEVKRFIL